MLARLILPLLLVASTALADCLPDPAVVEAIHGVRDTPCYGAPECLEGQLEDIERLLDERPRSIPLHRIRQDLALEAGVLEREATRSELIEQYRNHPELTPRARRYLVARLAGDEAGLREATTNYPWANLDLAQRRFELDHDALVDAAEAERLVEAFVAGCPDAAVLLASEAGGLLISVRWPVWGEVRRSLLGMDPPPWEHLDKLLIRAGLLQDGEGDPAERLLSELEAATGTGDHDDAGYWLYRARIHHQARDVDAAIEANARAREIDKCRQLPPWQRRQPEEARDWDSQWFDRISQEILDCPPDFETYQTWLLAVPQKPGLLEEGALARIRRTVANRSLGFHTYELEKQLAQVDICCSGHDPDSAWSTLERLFEESMSFGEHAEAAGIDPGARAVSLALEAAGLARLALHNDFPEQAEKWWQRADELFEANRAAIEDRPELQRFLTLMDAARSELQWLKARKDNRHADAVVHALSARAKELPWIDMEEVIASWQAAGGTEQGFEHLLEVWDLELPAKWRGWRRLEEPLEDFELADLDGRVWTLEDLKGKRTLVNLWAVWCGPCMLELPKVQELHERYRDDPSVQVLTVNLDEAEGVAREMMRREGYDFPVLMHGSDKAAFEGVGIPRNWLVDGQRIRQWEQTGFNPDVADHWVEDIASLIEQMQ